MLPLAPPRGAPPRAARPLVGRPLPWRCHDLLASAPAANPLSCRRLGAAPAATRTQPHAPQVHPHPMQNSPPLDLAPTAPNPARPAPTRAHTPCGAPKARRACRHGGLSKSERRRQGPTRVRAADAKVHYMKRGGAGGGGWHVGKGPGSMWGSGGRRRGPRCQPHRAAAGRRSVLGWVIKSAREGRGARCPAPKGAAARRRRPCARPRQGATRLLLGRDAAGPAGR
jgi:hypothetical protein